MSKKVTDNEWGLSSLSEKFEGMILSHIDATLDHSGLMLFFSPAPGQDRKPNILTVFNWDDKTLFIGTDS